MLKAVAEKFAPPKAIVVMSGHWVTDNQGVQVTESANPRTIREFYGFPRALYEMSYKAPGHPALAATVRSLAPEVTGDGGAWGLDHGSWTLLCHLYPNHDIPVIQLSVDNTKPGKFYYDLGRKLRGLRDDGILLMGSGSIVHNLRKLRWGGPAHSWAASFNNWVVENTMGGRREGRKGKSDSSEEAQQQEEEGPNDEALHSSFLDAPGGRQSVPAPDHYVPFIFALGAAHGDDERTKLIDWIDNGANGMTSFAFGL
jgi:4,5-DOPA dioxygenase extradiol